MLASPHGPSQRQAHVGSRRGNLALALGGRFRQGPVRDRAGIRLFPALPAGEKSWERLGGSGPAGRIKTPPHTHTQRFVALLISEAVWRMGGLALLFGHQPGASARRGPVGIGSLKSLAELGLSSQNAPQLAASLALGLEGGLGTGGARRWGRQLCPRMSPGVECAAGHGVGHSWDFRGWLSAALPHHTCSALP